MTLHPTEGGGRREIVQPHIAHFYVCVVQPRRGFISVSSFIRTPLLLQLHTVRPQPSQMAEKGEAVSQEERTGQAVTSWAVMARLGMVEASG